MLHLVNSGGAAKDIEIGGSCDGTMLEPLFIPSIGRNERVSVVQNAMDLREKGSRIEVHVKYEDTYGKGHQDDLTVDFGKLKEEKKNIPYVLSPFDVVVGKLDDIKRSIERLEKEHR